MARIPIAWEELPEEIQNRFTSKTLRELFISEGGQFYRAMHKKDGVRYYVASTLTRQNELIAARGIEEPSTVRFSI